MNAKRQLALLVLAASCFFLLILGAIVSSDVATGKLVIVSLFILPVFFVYLPVRFVISCRGYLAERPLLRFTAFGFSVSPLVLSVLFYVFMVIYR